MAEHQDGQPSSSDRIRDAREELRSEENLDTGVPEADSPPAPSPMGESDTDGVREGPPVTPRSRGSSYWSTSPASDLPPAPPDVRPWWQEAWVWVMAAVVVFGTLSLWNSGALEEPVEEQFMEHVEAAMREAGMSEPSWDCVESRLRDGGYINDLAAELEGTDPEVAWVRAQRGTAVTAPSPALRRFMKELVRLSANPSAGCVPTADIAAREESGPAVSVH